MKALASRVADLSAFVIFRAALAIYLTFFFQGFQVYRFSPLVDLPTLPLFDISPFHSLLFSVGVKILYLVFIVAFIVGFRVEVSGVIAGLSSLLLNFMYPGGVFAFSYYAPMVFIAFAATEVARKKRNYRLPPETALALFMSGLYLAAALHKLGHFDLMMSWISYDLSRWARPEFMNICANAACSMTKIAAYTVVPIELSLGLLFLFRRTRSWGMILSAVFHTGMYTVVQLRSVGILVFTTQCCIALLASGWTLRSLVSDRLVRKTVLFNFTFLFAYFAISYFPTPVIRFVNEFVLAIFVFLPLIAVGFLAFRDQSEKSFSARDLISWSDGLLVLFLLCFSLWPCFEHYRRTQSIGWGMFSGAYFQNPYHFIEVQPSPCEITPYPPVLNKSRKPNLDVYGSFDMNLLQRFTKRIHQDCPKTEVSEIKSTYLNPLYRPSEPQRSSL